MVVLGWRRCSRRAGHRVVHETGSFHLTDELVDESGAEKFLAADREHVSRASKKAHVVGVGLREDVPASGVGNVVKQVGPKDRQGFQSLGVRLTFLPILE